MNKFRLLFPALCCAAAATAAVTVPSSAPLRRGGVIVSGSAEVLPHTGFSAIDATEKGGYDPLEVAFRGQADARSGVIRLDYYPHFSAPGEKILLNSGNVVLGVTEKGLTLRIGRESFAAAARFQPRVWYEIELRWGNGRVAVTVDDRELLAVERAELPVGETVFFGGTPDGMLRNLAIDRPGASPLEQLSGKPLKFTVRSDNANCFTFDYFAHGAPLRVRLRPRLAIRPGEKFVAIQSAGDPMYLTAETAGELTLDLPNSYSNRVEVRRDPGNLLAAPGVKWRTAVAPGYRGMTTGIVAAPTESPKMPEAAEDAVTAAADGSGWIIDRRRDVGMVTLYTENIPVKPDTAYLLGLYHKVLADAAPGGSFILQVKIMADGAVRQTFREYHPFTPLRHTGKREFAPLRFKTAAGPAELTARIELISDAAPCRIAVSDLSLREYPTLLYQPMPRESERVRALTGDALLAHLKRRPAADVPRTDRPISGVAGYDGTVYKMMARAGVDLQFIKVTVDHRDRFPAWRADGTYDFSSIDRRILHVLSYAPDAKVGLMVGLDPALDFGIVHPDAAWRDISGKVVYMSTPDVRYFPERRGKKYPFVSFTAPVFRREAGKFLFALGEHLRTRPWGKTVAAIHLFGGGDGQWFYRPRKNDFAEMMDRSPGNLAAMREIIRRRYADDLTALRRAWGDAAVTFDTITFPTPESSRKYPYLRDPADPEARKLIDFARFYPEAVTETLGFAADEFERGLGRKVLKSRYYFGTSLGHLLTASPFDMLVSVPPYGVSRLHGAEGRVHQAPDSATLYGKAFLDELDLRTSYSPVSVYGTSNSMRWNGVEHGPEGFAAMMRKMAAPALTAAQGYWYLMIGGDSSLQDEFEPAVRESFAALKLGADRAVDLPDQAALFWDEEARTLMGDRFGWSMDQHGTHQAQKTLYRAGVSSRMYLLRDLTHPKRRPAKLNLFALGSSMTEEQIAYVEKNLQKDGNVLVFVFDAGRTAPGGFERNIRRLTGITVKAAPEGMRTLAAFGPERFSDPLSRYILNAPPLTAGPFMLPLFYVDDPEAKPLARLARTELVGAAVKRHRDWTAVYLSIPLGLAVRPEFIRELAREAGLTPFAPVGEVSYMGSGCVAIHAVSAGEKELNWGVPADVLDLTTGRIVRRRATALKIAMRYGETRWFRLLKPAE